MKELTVISGKGGTGKTTLVASFAALAKSKVLADCDVDAADLHLVLEPRVERSVPFSGGGQAVIRAERCSACGACERICRYGAVRTGGRAGGEATFVVDALKCEGCGVCVHFCPEAAIDFEPRESGEWYVSETRFGPMVHARLSPAQENSGKLVTQVRKEAARVASERSLDLVIIDGPPGIGCPVIASLGGATLALVVTEPTLSGIHDLRRIAGLAAHFGIPAGVCINKCDINPEISRSISRYAASEGIPVFGELPYDTAATKAQLAARSVVENGDSPLARDIRKVWYNAFSALQETGNE